MASGTRDLYIFIVVDTPEKLASILPILESANWVAVDTEADSLHAYPEKICLIQISTGKGDRLVDPLSRINLDLLLKALAGHELIMHGADYDLRLFNKHYNFVPKSIFDTMIAARLLGIRQFSLSSLVEMHLGVKLEKGPQKANWALRPLTERMERYARNDTHYLKPLADHLSAQLEEKGRLTWHRESCARLIADAAKEPPPDPDSLWRLKGSQVLDRPALAVLRELWRWREREARASNRPPFFILSHDSLVALASATSGGRPLDPILPRHLSDRRRGGLFKALAHAMSLSPEHHPRVLKLVSRRPSDGEKRRYQEIRKRRDVRAAQLGIDPTLIASRATMASLAHNWEKYAADLMSWQRELLS